MRAHTMENPNGIKRRFIVKHCTPFTKVGCPGIGHLVQLADRAYENPDAQKRFYLSLKPYEKDRSFDRVPKTMAELPLIHSENDYKIIRSELLKRKFARKLKRP